MVDARLDASRGIRKPRKSRGRGLRATTGWSVICIAFFVSCRRAYLPVTDC